MTTFATLTGVDHNETIHVNPAAVAGVLPVSSIRNGVPTGCRTQIYLLSGLVLSVKEKAETVMQRFKGSIPGAGAPFAMGG